MNVADRRPRVRPGVGVRTGKTPEIRAQIAAGRRSIDIARDLGVSEARVYQVRRAMSAEAGAPVLSTASDMHPERRAMTPAEPEDVATVADLAAMRRPFVADGGIDAVIRLDGGNLIIKPASLGRVTLMLHEQRQGSAVVRVDRAQLTSILEQLAAALDALPEVTPCG